MAAQRVFTGLAMCIACALCFNVARQGYDTDPALNLPRQNFDADTRSDVTPPVTGTTEAVISTVEPASNSKDALAVAKSDTHTGSATPPSGLFDGDIPYQELEFGTRDIDTLLDTGAVPFALPGHAPVMLTLHKHQQQFGGDRISVQHGDTLSTITRRGEVLFATIALPSGSFRLEGRGDVSRIYPHKTLAQRANLYEVDYRHVH